MRPQTKTKHPSPSIKSSPSGKKKLTWIGRQADRPNEVGYRNAVVQPQQRDVVVKVEEAELLGDGSQHEPGLRPDGVVATVVLSKRHLDHEPHETGRKDENNLVSITKPGQLASGLALRRRYIGIWLGGESRVDNTHPLTQWAAVST